MKTCIRCHVDQPVEAFYGHKRRCKACLKIQRAEAASPAYVLKRRASQKRYRLAHPEIAGARKTSGRRQIAGKKWTATHPDRVRAKQKRWRAQHPDYQRAWQMKHTDARRAWKRKYHQTEAGRAKQRQYQLRRYYGITPARVAELLEQQDGRCAICRIAAHEAPKGMLCVDHDHLTGVVRGLLCRPCNYMLGHVNDNAATLRSAATYLDAAAAITEARRGALAS